MRRLLTLVTLVVSAPLLAATFRLPTNVIPSHYELRIEPRLGPETFSGSETIDVDVAAPTDSITLHSVDLDVHDVFVRSGERRLPATVTADKTNEAITLKTAEPIPAGKAAIELAFDGKLLPQLRGLYLSTTAKRKYAVTQFEATSARRAFPSFDEPELKAQFDVTLVVDKGDVAISNEAMVSDTPLADGRHAVRFGRTKRISTYLVAMLVGDFRCISGESEGTPLRVCATPGLETLGTYALDAAKASLTYFNRYYGIRYPFAKLDMVGIPDFSAGAMENAGAITFREQDLLLDPKSGSVLFQKRIAEVVAHEIAHQWFGDLVTMKWWTDIWLNEGFATFMSWKPIDVWKPEWRIELDRPLQTDDALTADSGRTTRPIRLGDTSEGGLFDPGIVYGKTAAVLRMTEDWLGREAFRDAIRGYLDKYSYRNAAAEDLWATLGGKSNQPVGAVLRTFVDLPGVPLLHPVEQCDASGRKITITQERLLPKNAPADPKQQLWTIPVCPHAVGAKSFAPCSIVDEKTETITVASTSCDRPLVYSNNGSGYFIVDYPQSTRAELRKRIAELTPQERIAHHGNEWILVRAERRDSGEYLDLVRSLPQKPERQIVTNVVDNLALLNERLANDANRAAWQRFVGTTLRRLAPATWTAPANETSEQRIARGAVLFGLATIAGDKDVIAAARRTAEQYMDKPGSVDAVIADRALRVAAMYGDAPFLDRVLKLYETAPSPELASRYRSMIPLFRDPALRERVVAFLYGKSVRDQDLFVTASMMFDPVNRVAGWNAAKAHWSELEARSGQATGRVISALGGFCSAEAKKEVEAFFAEHPPKPGQQRGLTRAYDAIDACIAFRGSQQASFDAALNSR